MASINPKRFILQAIEHLRGRKARPDLHRICNMLKKRHSFNFADTTRCIENLMDMGIIIKVEYKGSISYRDAARWKKGHVAGQIINSDVLVSKIQGAIDAIESQARAADGNHANGCGDSADSTEEIGGGTKEEIEQYLRSQNGEANCQLSGDAMFEALIREVERQTLRKICDRYFVGKRVIPSPQQRRSRSPVKLSESSPKAKRAVSASPNPDKEDSSSDAGSVRKRGRPPSKRKRFKKNHGDDFEVLPIGKPRKVASAETQDADTLERKELDLPPELAPESSLHEKFRRCNDDHLTEVPSRHEGQEQDLLVCTICHIKAHPYCVNYSEERLERIDRNTWRCVTCKQCSVCNSFVKAAIPVICSGCDKAYHRSCHQPILKKRPKDGWKCSECVTDAQVMGLVIRQQVDHDDLSLHDSLPSSVHPENAETEHLFHQHPVTHHLLIM
ncbi:chromodomain-helicase-DNA-binding protein Mi-2 homolog [Pomacea canaliculata]|uniref:chromodomain-helicase-DNA-binding protein Mi-2 homolog n=1 Tax=Pomacea canaliculata TaxID=400727 RepID=UPI000D73CFA7|nr:chromodomain-helicase-DNA-binding protein Mi-2 homolog [Pomacea canaliculata]XP_025110835.1 chromodomain-helicase-DNA-binding protein Mi-2 homolog [Pomacea canaliculata]